MENREAPGPFNHGCPRPFFRRLRFPLPKLAEAALEHLTRICRFDPRDRACAPLLKDAIAVHDTWAAGAALRAAVAFYGGDALAGRRVTAGGGSVVCAAFARIVKTDVYRVVPFALSLRTGIKTGARRAGGAEAGAGKGSLTWDFYADVWEDAYVSAGMGALRRALETALRTELAPGLRPDGLRLSDAFGPGLYGMAPAAMTEISKMVSFEGIGARVAENGLIRPAKSRGGLFFAAAGTAGLPALSCRACSGDRQGCDFCGGVVSEGNAGRPQSGAPARIRAQSAAGLSPAETPAGAAYGGRR